MSTIINIETELGAFSVVLADDRAPITTTNFLAYVDGGYVGDMTAYRIVTQANQPPETVHRIEVVQWGWRSPDSSVEQPFPAIAHEPTSQTGLRHGHLTISMARTDPGTAGPGFFICIGEQPELDEGGRRNPDGAGFAAFGKVISGEETVLAMFGKAEAVEYIEKPIQFLSAMRA